MSSWFINIYINDKLADTRLYNSLLSLEVEDNGYNTSTFRMKLAVSKNDHGEWDLLNDERFTPLSNVIIKAGFNAPDADATKW